MICVPYVYPPLPEPLTVPDVAAAGDVLTGTPVSRGTAAGPARVVRSAEDAAKLVKGEIMVAVYTDIGWSPYYCLIEGLVTEIGGALSHGAVVAREYALPFVSNVAAATSLIRTGDMITVNGSDGTVTRHYYKYLKGERTSTNPIATIFAWSGALGKRGELDGIPELTDFAARLEKACLDTLKSGIMTSDLAPLVEPGFETKTVDSWELISAIAANLQ